MSGNNSDHDETFRIDKAEIDKRAAGQWAAIMNHFYPQASEAWEGGKTFCPWHGGDSGEAFWGFDNFATTGGCGCNSCANKKFSDGYAFLCTVHNWGFNECLQKISKLIFTPIEYEELNKPKFERRQGRGRPPGSKNKNPSVKRSSPTSSSSSSSSSPSPQDKSESDKHSAEIRLARTKLGSAWQQAKPDQTRIKSYLVSRGLAIDPPPTLRFYDALYFSGKAHNGEEVTGNFPAMAAKVESPSDGFVARHVTWLSTVTDGKLEVKDAKKFNDTIYKGALTGAAIRLYPSVDDKPLFLAEGIETALALRQAFAGQSLEESIPVWATGSAHNTANAQIPPSVKLVAIWPDRDEAGETAAREAADRLAREGHTVRIVALDPAAHPPKTDALDILVEPELGESYLRSLWDDAQRATPHNPSPSWETKEPKELSDVELANLVLPIIKPFHRAVPSWNCWMSWDGRRWVRNTGRALRESLQQLGIDGGEGHPLQSTNRINKVITELSAKSELNVEHTQFDKQHHLLNAMNGTIDLRSGELLPHNQDNFLTHLIPHEYNPALTNEHCPNWLNTMNLTWPATDEQPDRPATMTAFFQRLCGYTLTGSTQEQIITILHGEGSNGKSTIVDLIQQIMGEDIAITLPSSLVTVRREEHPTALASLLNRRMAYSVETGEQAKLNEESMKRLSGSDRILARRMNENFWEFKPTHKVWIATNHKPKIQGTDHAIWRRLVLVPFEQTYWSAERGESGPEQYQQIKDYDKVLHSEILAIFTWIVRGASDWYKSGLQQPSEIRIATEKYREEEDVVGRFIDECCNVNSQLKTTCKVLYQAYEKWCKENGIIPQASKVLGNKLQSKKFKDKKVNGCRGYHGIGVKAEYLEDAQHRQYSDKENDVDGY